MRASTTHKKVLVLGAAVLAVTSTAGAQVLVCEDFSYPDGSLVPNGGWANHSGTVGDMLVSGGQVVVQHGAPSEDANISFAPVPGVLYYGLDFSVDDLGAPYTAGGDYEYFAHFRTGFDFSARFDIVAPTGAGDFTVGISSDSSTADTIWGADLTYGTTYRAIVSYDQDANIAELWIDAAVSTDPSIVGADQPDPGDSVVSFALRQSDSSENETVRVDNVTVGLTFADNLGTGSCTGGTQTLRFAASPNPGVFNIAGQPNIGTTWNPTVEATGSILDILMLSTVFDPGTVLPFGTLLCGIPAPPFIFTGTAGEPFLVPIPNDPVLLGANVCTQGGGLDATLTPILANAIDLVVGG